MVMRYSSFFLLKRLFLICSIALVNSAPFSPALYFHDCLTKGYRFPLKKQDMFLNNEAVNFFTN